MRLLTIISAVVICGSVIAGQAEQSQVASALAEAEADYEAMMLEQTINGAQSVIRRLQNKSTKESEEMGRKYIIHREAKRILVEEYEVDPVEAEKAIIEHLQSDCPEIRPSCSGVEKYRRANGSCNNLQNPLWGSTYQPLARLLEAEYEGEPSVDEPRGGLDSSLPSPRSISLLVHKSTSDIAATTVTHMVAQFGQFLDHDISLTPEGGQTCCSVSGVQTHTDCWAIQIDPDDEFYGEHGVECLEFTRSTPSCSASTSTREQMNIITAFIDGSNVYGSDDRLTKMLRKFSGGELVENIEIKGGFLPWSSDVDPNTDSPGNILAGDRRANEMPGLTVLHILFLKEHNRIAKEFAATTDWDDETIFQETRRIVGAEMQQITYGEYLPAILGPGVMEEYGLTITDLKTTYNASMDPTIFNSFATAAYRFGHTLVNGLIIKYAGDREVGRYNVRDNYFIQDQIINRASRTMSGFDEILNGLIRQAAQASDSQFSQDLTNHLFKFGDFIGSDLAARNIQRGRDHGIPGYNKFRVRCGLRPITDWNVLPDQYTQAQWDILRLAYDYGNSTVNDIDLYTGGLSQIPLAGAQTGHTFACLMGMQFQRLKFGDRFFFSHSNQIGSFTDEQFENLRTRKFGDIICDNSGLTETRSNVFQLASEMVRCDNPSRTKLNITLFATGTSGSTEIIVNNRLLVFLVTLKAVFLVLCTS